MAPIFPDLSDRPNCTRMGRSELLDDGYVRITLPAFYALHFHQYICFRDLDLLNDLWREGVPAIDAGYYELVCIDMQPTISIGCAWHITAGERQIAVGKDDISSNVMLLDESGSDCGVRYSRTAIWRWLCSEMHQRDLESAINR